MLKTAAAALRRGGQQADSVVSTLDVWDGQLASAGAEVIAARQSLVAELAEHVARAYEQVSGGQGRVTLGYRASLDEALEDGTRPEPAVERDLAELREQLLHAMVRLRRREIERGICLVGPHRDDLLATIGGLPARGYASHGESWSLALALRLASYELLRADASGEWSDGGEPVLVLDDVFAELDGGRRERLARMVASADQVLVTAAAQEDVPSSLSGARFDVLAGEVTRVR